MISRWSGSNYNGERNVKAYAEMRPYQGIEICHLEGGHYLAGLQNLHNGIKKYSHVGLISQHYPEIGICLNEKFAYFLIFIGSDTEKCMDDSHNQLISDESKCGIFAVHGPITS